MVYDFVDKEIDLKIATSIIKNRTFYFNNAYIEEEIFLQPTIDQKV